MSLFSKGKPQADSFLSVVLVLSLALALVAERVEGKPGPPLTEKKTLRQPRLELTCRPENGYPNSVSCSGAEWFVQGYSDFCEDISDSGYLPYGQVSCCRPDSPDLDSIHVKCSARRDVNNCALMRHNPSNLSSFLTGFSDSLRIDTEYAPKGSAICCDAIAEAKDGTRRYITPCECEVTREVLCPNTTGSATARVMTGFLITTNIGVPLTPAECCGMCLGEQVPPDGDCSRYNHCSGRGACHGGFCECVDGYMGMDCSLRHTLTPEALFKDYAWEILVCSLSSTVVFLWIFFFVRRSRQGEGGSGAASRGARGREENLMDYIEIVESETDESGEGGGEDEESSSGDEETGETHLCKGLESSLESAAQGQDGLLKKGGKGETNMCVICMSSEKLVVLVPCGHTSICRKCSRRVDHCPFCRAQIFRRQKIFRPA